MREQIYVYPPELETGGNWNIYHPECVFSTLTRNDKNKQEILELYDLRKIGIHAVAPLTHFSRSDRFFLESQEWVDEFDSHLIKLFGIPKVPVEEAVDMLIATYSHTFIKNPDNTDYKKVFSRNTAKYSDWTHETIEIVTEIISDLRLPESYANLLKEAILKVPINIKPIGRTCYRFSGNKRWIEIGINRINYTTKIMQYLDSKYDGFDLEKHAFHVSQAHEIGHLLDQVPVWFLGIHLDRPLYISTIIPNPRNFPVNFQDFLGETRMHSNSERFTGYFELETAKKLGLDPRMITDVRCIETTLVYNVMKSISPNRLAWAVYFLNKKLPEESPIRVEAVKKISAIISGHSFGQVFPMSDKEVYQAIVVGYEDFW